MRCDARAFTLVEVLVALSILSIVVIVAMKNSGTTADNAVYLKERTLAHWVAMNKAAEVQLAEKWVAAGKTQGEVRMAENDWHWTLLVVDTPDADVRRAEIAVQKVDAEGAPLARLTLFVGRP
ncbi:type II secretion system minor pseudopilin GspI [Thermodesulfobacteriota bacterium]